MSASPLKVALVAVNSPGYRSLALGYLRAYAEAHPALAGRVAFQTLDMDTAVSPWWVAYRVLSMEPDVVALSVNCWNADAVHAACRVLAAARPRMPIVLGGPEVGPVAEEVLRRHAAVTAVVRGEGESTFADALSAFLRDGELWRVEGVTARRGGEVVSADDRPLIADLDSIPSPYLAGVMPVVDGATYLETYRGCPNSCGYCFEGKGYGRVRRFSEQRVREEIDCVAHTPGITSFSFIDPVFNLPGDRFERLCEHLAFHAVRGVRLHTIELDVEAVGPGQAAMLRRAGVVSVEVGPQTVGATALETCRRRFDRERFVAGVTALKAQGISVECDLIVGLPGDTFDDVVDGWRFVTSLDPWKIQCSTLRVLPGTDLFIRADELGLAFDPEPPHEVVATGQMGFVALRRAEVAGTVLSEEHGARLEGGTV